MTTLRANRLFYALMTFAVVGALFIPNRVSDRGRAHVQVLFAPVALPTRWVVATAHNWIWPPRARDDASPDKPRGGDAVYAENQVLRVELANLAGQLEHYRLQAGVIESLGDIAKRCTKFAVTGPDTGTRRSLGLVGRGAGSLQRGMAVLTPNGLIGRIERAGTGGAQALLLTDKEVVVTGVFGRYMIGANGSAAGGNGKHVPFELLNLPPTLIAGTGGATLRSDKLPMKAVEAAGVRAGDYVVLDDRQWPDDLKWYRIGVVSSIRPSRQHVLMAEIEIEPMADAGQLRDVLVLNR